MSGFQMYKNELRAEAVGFTCGQYGSTSKECQIAQDNFAMQLQAQQWQEYSGNLLLWVLGILVFVFLLPSLVVRLKK